MTENALDPGVAAALFLASALAPAVATWAFMVGVWKLSGATYRATSARLSAWDRGEPREPGALGWIVDALARREVRKRCALLQPRLPHQAPALRQLRQKVLRWRA